MFPKSLRMGKHHFQEILGKKPDLFINEPILLVKYYKQPLLRLSVVISKESIKLASARNRVKRIIRGEISSKINELTPGFYVIIVKRGIDKETLTYEKINSNVHNFLSKISKP